MGPFVDVVVPFWVNGVRVEKTYLVIESWHELCRVIAEDIGRAPALELRPVMAHIMGLDVNLCVDTGSSNGSVAVHYVDPAQWDHIDDGDLLGLLNHRTRVKRPGFYELSEPYAFTAVKCPVKDASGTPTD